jgi:hypothetical protein
MWQIVPRQSRLPKPRKAHTNLIQVRTPWLNPRFDRSKNAQRRTIMQALTDFLTTDYGLMSLAVIAFMFVMLGYIAWYVAQHVKQDTERHDKDVREGRAQ